MALRMSADNPGLCCRWLLPLRPESLQILSASAALPLVPVPFGGSASPRRCIQPCSDGGIVVAQVGAVLVNQLSQSRHVIPDKTAMIRGLNHVRLDRVVHINRITQIEMQRRAERADLHRQIQQHPGRVG